ncbi:MAG: AMP-binding protein [Hyphomicrobiaceae bacterium]
MRALRDTIAIIYRKLAFTGEPIDDETALWAKETFGRLPCSIYGSTEVGVIIADYPGAGDHAVRLGALGKPVPGQTVAVLDASGAPCPPGQVGEIMLQRRDSWFPRRTWGSSMKTAISITADGRTTSSSRPAGP